MSRKKTIPKPVPANKQAAGKPEQDARGSVTRLAVRIMAGAAILPAALIVMVTGLFSAVNPPVTPIMAADYWRLGYLKRQWVEIDSVPMHLPLSLIAAEDSNFCLHWGFDVDAIRASESGGGASLSQQTARGLYLWRGGGSVARVLETIATGVIELIWTKRRIAEVYMNIAEFESGVFGVEAAARQYFSKGAAALSDGEAASLASARAAPLSGSPAALTPERERRAAVIREGAQLIAQDQRSACIGG